MRLPVTVCIPVRDEEANLPACLAALDSLFEDIVVIDSLRSAETRAIAEAVGARTMQFEWDGRFPKKRNWTLRHYEFKTPWVLFLDADERMTPAFVDELHRVLPATRHVGFWVSFDNWFLGSPLQHGDALRKLALFRVGAGEYERFPEDRWSHLDMEVHEHPDLDGTTAEATARLEHRDRRGLEHYIAKHREYASWEANRFLWLEAAGPGRWSKLGRRQRFKYRHLDKWWFAWAYWGAAYVWKRGFLDGRVGFTFNRLKRNYFSQVRIKIRESRTEAKLTQHDPREA